MRIRAIRKADIPVILNEESLWSDDFIVGTRHRLIAHYNNPKASDDDMALLIAYIDDKPAGYMGIYIDQVHLGDRVEKIGWLSTWWLHKSSVGKGLGKEMLKTMYELNDGKIGISQFTPSAKRVYDKSGYFYYLKKLQGCKIDLRLHLSFLLPAVRSSYQKLTPLLRLVDGSCNLLIDLKLQWVYSRYKKTLRGLSVDYLTYVDETTEEFIRKKQTNSLTRRDADFFQFLKTFQWIEEAPLLELVTNHKRYSFSGYNQEFNIYLLKIEEGNSGIIGFVSLLKKDHELKVLQLYYEPEKHDRIARIIIMHGIRLGIKTIITYDENITREFKQLTSARIRFKAKERESIISKVYGDIDYTSFDFQYGDGDCSFA